MLQPLARERWNSSTAAHLLNRAGFGGTPAEIEALAKLSPEDAVKRLVEFDAIPDSAGKPAWAEPDPDRLEKLRRLREAPEEERRQLQRERQREHRRQTVELQHWWLQRMAKTPRPLQEKLTLFWHGHFATSIQKVKEPYLMWRQNEMFRQHGSSSWFTLLDEVTRDPAMLIWLDQAQSRPGHPNENYARELLELFTLGEGHYTESDVLEAARALTGLTLDRARLEPVNQQRLHDPGQKTILGRTGAFDGFDLLKIVADQPPGARFLVAKLWTFFAAENPQPQLTEALAVRFRLANGQIRPLLRTIFLSEEFYDDAVVRQQIKSPVQFLVSACRQLGRDLPPPMVSSNILRLLGQELFAPPNVKGWDGGAAWINTNTLLARHNLSLLLVTGESVLPAAPRRPASPQPPERSADRLHLQPINVEAVFEGVSRHDSSAILDVLEHKLLQAKFRTKERATLLDYLQSHDPTSDASLRSLVRLAMCTADYQLT